MQNEFTDFEMFIPSNFHQAEPTVFKIVKITAAERMQIDQQLEANLAQVNKKTSLSVLGVGPSGDILFTYTNSD